ncbi:MAG: Xaa-Pro peptidase family protein [Lentisphaeria bacterium]
MNTATGRFLFASGESHPDLLYATGIPTPDPFLWFKLPEQPAVVVLNPLEIGRGRKLAKPGLAVLSEHEARSRFALPDSRPASAANLLAAIARQHNIHHWETSSDCPLRLARALEAEGLTLEAVQPFFPERAIKTAAEIAAIRDGVRLAERGLDAALLMIRTAVPRPDGLLELAGEVLTAEAVRGEICAVIARAGGLAAHTIVAPGPQAADPHGRGEGPLRAGEPILMDIFPRVEATGYHGDLTRTVVYGRASEVVRRAFAAVQAAQNAARRTVRAGVPGRDVHQAADNALAAAGFATDLRADPPVGFIHGLGHGLGLEVHEPPRCNRIAVEPLAAGHVITLEPGLYDPAWGGIRLEDVVAVTETGCDTLTRAPVFLEL